MNSHEIKLFNQDTQNRIRAVCNTAGLADMTPWIVQTASTALSGISREAGVLHNKALPVNRGIIAKEERRKRALMLKTVVEVMQYMLQRTLDLEELTPVREWVKHDSSTLDESVYDDATSVLKIKFKNGGIYKYDNVPVDVYESLTTAASSGKFLNSAIKGKYAFTKLS